MKISNILQVVLMGWIVGIGIANRLPLMSMLAIALMWSIPMFVANFEFALHKSKLNKR